MRMVFHVDKDTAREAKVKERTGSDGGMREGVGFLGAEIFFCENFVFVDVERAVEWNAQVSSEVSRKKA